MTIRLLILCLILSWVDPQQTFSVVGSIRDTKGRPVGDIRVSLSDENYQPISTRFADSSGRFTFRGLRSGKYYLRVEPTGKPYEELSQNLELQATSIRRGAGEEPFVIDLVLKSKPEPRLEVSPGLLFTQTVPPAASAEYEHAVNSLRDNKTAEGLASLRRAIELFPDYFLALELLGAEQVRLGEYAEALSPLTHALEVNRKAPKSLYALGVAHLKLNHSEEAIGILKAAADQDPQNANTYLMLGLAYGAGRPDEAEASFKQAYDLGREKVAEVHLYLAAIYNKQQKYSAAIQELETFLKEAKEVKDRTQIKEMIEKLKAKERSK